jgi:predicted nucleotidyltransferase
MDHVPTRQSPEPVGMPCAPRADVDVPLLDEIVARLRAALQPERMNLFGSRARGDARADSDYALLLIARERQDKPERMELRATRTLRGIPATVDVVIVSRAYFD